MDRKSLHEITYGIYIISSKSADRFNGAIINTVMQVISEPPTIAVSVCKGCLTYDFVEQSKIFTISMLAKETPLKFIGLFGFRSGRDIDKFKDIKYKVGVTGAPIVLENTLAYLEAEVIASLDVGDHTIFIGKVVEGQILKEGEPLTYDYYHKIIRGKTPQSAPTYIGDRK